MRIGECQIHCKKCNLLSSDESARGFTIQVPIDPGSQKAHLQATILCQIFERSHKLTLQGLYDSAGREVILSTREKSKLAAALKSVEKKRLCGNAKICPQCIVELAAELYNSM